MPGRCKKNDKVHEGQSEKEINRERDNYAISLIKANFRCSPSKSGDPEDMDAWEISMRLDMADIQKKYRYTDVDSILRDR